MANNNHFNLTLDSTAPVATLTASAIRTVNGTVYAKAANDVTLSLTQESGNGAVYQKVWVDSTQVQTTVPRSANWAAVNTAPTLSLSTTPGKYYYHAILMDAVGNESAIATSLPVCLDTAAPTITGATLTGKLGDNQTASTSITATKTVTLSFTVADSGLSGLYQVKITGDLSSAITLDQAACANLSNGVYSGTITLKNDDDSNTLNGAVNTITITAEDLSGNTATATASILVDTKAPSPAITLKKKGTTTNYGGSPSYISCAASGTTLKAGVGDGLVPTREIDVNGTGPNDVKSYKIWEGTEPTSYTEFTNTSGTAFNVTKTITLSAGNGLKTVYVKLQDDAGNISTVSKTICVDSTAPAQKSLTTNATKISKQSGHNSATITVPAMSDGESGIAGWRVYSVAAGDTTQNEWKTGTTGATDTITVTGDSTKLSVGNNSFYLEMWDKAGNITRSAALVIELVDTFNLTVNAPATSSWYKASNLPSSVTVSSNRPTELATVYAWYSTTATDQTVPTGATAAAGGDNQVTVSIDKSKIAESSGNYLHVKAIDIYGNVVYSHTSGYKYDATSPSAPTKIVWGGSVYNTRNASVTVTFSSTADATSGINAIKVSGDIGTVTHTLTAIEKTNGSATIDVTINSSATTYSPSVSARLIDVAGNESAACAAASVEYDPVSPSAILHVLNMSGTQIDSGKTNDLNIQVTIEGLDDAGVAANGNITGYKLWGDFGTGTTATIKPGSYTNYAAKVTVSKTLISGDADKYIYLETIDNAGNTASAIVKVTLDTTIPEVTTDITAAGFYSTVSKVHALRKTSATADSTYYCDETIFKFTANDGCSAYKVCAYNSTSDATSGYPTTTTYGSKTYSSILLAQNAWVEAQTAIANTYGSSNVSGSSIAANSAITVKITGRDLEKACGGDGDDDSNKRGQSGNKDGAKVIVVYVKDPQGNWSTKAVF